MSRKTSVFKKTESSTLSSTTTMGIRRARGVHYVVAVLVGVASGVAVFKEPLERERRRQLLLAQQQQQQQQQQAEGFENDPGETTLASR
jgi:hypothetical protein